MKIFGTIFPFVESNDDSLKLGRFVANYEFLKALLRFGNFEEYHLFCMSVNHFKMTEQKLLEEDLPITSKEKVRLFLYGNLIEQISNNSYHCFHLGGWGYFFPALVYIRNRHSKNQFPISGLIHSLNGIETNFHSLKMLRAPLKSYDTIVCSSSAGKKVVENIFSEINNDMQPLDLNYKGSFKVIPLGVTDEYIDKTIRKTVRENIGISENCKVFITVGRVSPQTKYDPYPLISTFADVVKNNPNKELKLIIAGGATKSTIALITEIIKENSISKHVIISPNFSDKQKKELYLAADICLALSDNLQETFGISIIEAMSASLPVIASDINGYKELIDEDINGYKIPTFWNSEFEHEELSGIMNFDTMQLMLAQNMAINTEVLKDKMQLLIDNPNEQIRLGNNGLKKVKDSFLWKTVIKKYEKLWDNSQKKSININPAKDKSKDPFAQKYSDIFSHYPTKFISENSLIKITLNGISALQHKTIPLAYRDIQPLLNSNLIINVLNYLNNYTDNKIKVFELKQQITNLDNFLILWLAKYGFISIDEDKNS